MTIKHNGTLFLITARGSSKGVHLKNLQPIGGLSLIGWKARVARQVMAQQPSCKSRLIISTDHPEMQREAAMHGVEVPFTRPWNLATDEASSRTVIEHAMEWCYETQNEIYDSVMLLEPSSPFATAAHMAEAFGEFHVQNADLVVGMKAVVPHRDLVGNIPPQGRQCASLINQMKRAKSQGYTYLGPGGSLDRRQDAPPQWTMNGAMYLFRWDMFWKHRDIYASDNAFGVLMDFWHSIEIDDRHDLEMARYAVDAGHVLMPQPPSWLQRMEHKYGPF